MDSIALLADSETLLGFRLAGLRNVFVAKDNVDASLEEALLKPNQGILVVTQDVVDRASVKMKRRLEQSTKPVIVVIPSKNTKTLSAASELASMVKRAMGVDLFKG